MANHMTSLNERVEGVQGDMARFFQEQMSPHFTELTSLKETARKTVTTLSQVSTTRDFITAKNQMIETRFTNEGISRDVDGIKSGLAMSDRKHKELFEKLEGKFDAQRNDIHRATDMIETMIRQYTYDIKRENKGIRNHIGKI